MYTNSSLTYTHWHLTPLTLDSTDTWLHWHLTRIDLILEWQLLLGHEKLLKVSNTFNKKKFFISFVIILITNSRKDWTTIFKEATLLVRHHIRMVSTLEHFGKASSVSRQLQHAISSRCWVKLLFQLLMKSLAVFVTLNGTSMVIAAKNENL